MAQFAAYKNKNPGTRAAYPLLVDIQSDLLEGLQTRVVVPLARLASLVKMPIKNVTPIVEIDSRKYVLLLPQLAGIPLSHLGAPVGSVGAYRDEIIASLDFLITGI